MSNQLKRSERKREAGRHFPSDGILSNLGRKKVTRNLVLSILSHLLSDHSRSDVFGSTLSNKLSSTMRREKEIFVFLRMRFVVDKLVPRFKYDLSECVLVFDNFLELVSTNDSTLRLRMKIPI